MLFAAHVCFSRRTEEYCQSPSSMQIDFWVPIHPLSFSRTWLGRPVLEASLFFLVSLCFLFFVLFLTEWTSLLKLNGTLFFLKVPHVETSSCPAPRRMVCHLTDPPLFCHCPWHFLQEKDPPVSKSKSLFRTWASASKQIERAAEPYNFHLMHSCIFGLALTWSVKCLTPLAPPKPNIATAMGADETSGRTSLSSK